MRVIDVIRGIDIIRVVDIIRVIDIMHGIDNITQDGKNAENTFIW